MHFFLPSNKPPFRLRISFYILVQPPLLPVLLARMNCAWPPIVNCHPVSHNTEVTNFPTHATNKQWRDKPRCLHEKSWWWFNTYTLNQIQCSHYRNINDSLSGHSWIGLTCNWNLLSIDYWGMSWFNCVFSSIDYLIFYFLLNLY